MQIADIKRRLSALEDKLAKSLLVSYEDFEVNGKSLKVYLSNSLQKRARKARVWKTKEFCITLRNAKYGLDPYNTKSKGGRDGVYLLDRDFKPANEMQKRIFDQFIDKSNSDFSAIVEALKLSYEQVRAVRVVSHHMRLLGISHTGKEEDILVIVDVDKKS